MTNSIADFTKTLLSQLDIVDVIQARLSLRKAGSNYQAVCPFHTENTPSFSVNPQKQFFYCFGCQASGDAIHFVMRYDNMTFMDALEHLASKQGLSLPQRQQQSETQRDRTVFKVMRDMTLMCRKDLQQTQKMTDYLLQRGLTLDTIQKYHLGYCGRHYLQWFDQAKVDVSRYLLQGGIASGTPGQIKPKFFKRLMFPIQDSTGKVIGFGGRTTDDNGPKYLNSPETDIFKKRHVLYGLHQFRKTKQHAVFIVEGYMDVLALHSHGLDNAVACLGTAFTGQHWHLLKRYVQKVTFCFDGDRAGKNAAWKSLEAILPGLCPTQAVSFLFLPEGHDPDSYLQAYGAKEFLAYCKHAISWNDYLFGKLEKEHAVATLNGKAALIQAATNLIQRVENQSLQIVLKDRLETLTAIKQTTEVPAQTQKTPNKDKLSMLCENIVKLLLNKDETTITSTEALDHFTHMPIIEHINTWFTMLQQAPLTTGDTLLASHQGLDTYAYYAALRQQGDNAFVAEKLEATILLLRCEIIESVMQRMLGSAAELSSQDRDTIQSLIRTKKQYQQRYRDLQRTLLK